VGKSFRKEAKHQHIPESQLKNLVTEQKFKTHRKNILLPILNLQKNSVWELDLIDFKSPQYANQNQQYQYILTVIDQNTRYVWMRELFAKSPTKVLVALKSIVEEAEAKPKTILSDKGNEFKGGVKRYLDQNHIKIITKFDHARFVERAIKTLKGMLGRHFEANNTRKWRRVIQDICWNYNNKIHSSLHDTPYNVYYHDSKRRQANIYMMWNYLKRKRKVEAELSKLPKLDVGDKVRLQIDNAYQRSYQEHFSPELYTITEVLPHQYYKLENIQRHYPRCELLKVNPIRLLKKPKPIASKKQLKKALSKAKSQTGTRKAGLTPLKKITASRTRAGTLRGKRRVTRSSKLRKLNPGLSYTK
jgi:hypothetical protein